MTADQTHCSICLDLVTPAEEGPVYYYKCNHEIHTHCFSKWNGDCPSCRAPRLNNPEKAEKLKVQLEAYGNSRISFHLPRRQSSTSTRKLCLTIFCWLFCHTIGSIFMTICKTPVMVEGEFVGHYDVNNTLFVMGVILLIIGIAPMLMVTTFITDYMMEFINRWTSRL